MGKSILVSLTTIVVVIAGVGCSAFAATAPSYVNNAFDAGCSEAGGASRSKPFAR